VVLLAPRFDISRSPYSLLISKVKLRFSDKRLLAARARGLHAAQRAVDCRRDHHRVLPHGAVVRDGALERNAAQPDIMTFAKGVTSGYLPLGGMMVSRTIRELMDSVKPADRCCTPPYSAHPTCRPVALATMASRWANGR